MNQTPREKVRELTVKINQQLKRAGVINPQGTKVIKPLATLPDSEWKTWITDLIELRNKIEETI